VLSKKSTGYVQLDDDDDDDTETGVARLGKAARASETGVG
jgi:hypothetical protein